MHEHVARVNEKKNNGRQTKNVFKSLIYLPKTKKTNIHTIYSIYTYIVHTAYITYIIYTLLYGIPTNIHKQYVYTYFYLYIQLLQLLTYIYISLYINVYLFYCIHLGETDPSLYTLYIYQVNMLIIHKLIERQCACAIPSCLFLKLFKLQEYVC